jgi:putative endonuclease
MSRYKGDLAENRACQYVENLGFFIIDRNFYSRFGEIDIIASKDDILHFIEVKSSTSYEAVYNITPSKLKKIIKTANLYIKKFNIDKAFCIDAVIVQGQDIEFLENITM